MTTKKMSVSFPPELSDEIQAQARAAGMSVSAWLAEAAAAHVRSQRLREALDAYQEERGSFTEEEIDHARERLGLPRPRRARRRSVA